MGVKEQLLLEHSKPQALRVAKLACKNAQSLKNLVQCYLSKDQHLAQRAAWSLLFVTQSKPALVQPYLQKILLHCTKPNLHDAVRRNGMRLLDYLEFPERLQGKIYATAMQLFTDKQQAIAVRVFAITSLVRIAKAHPELAAELILLIESELEESPQKAFIARSKKLLPQLYRLKAKLN